MRLSTIVTATAGLALIGSSVVGLAAPANGVAHRSPAPAAHARAWMNAASAASLRAAHGAGVRFAPELNKPDVPELSELVPAGHLGGRKEPVVLDVRETKLIGDGGTVGITARAGRTGAGLWSKTFPGTVYFSVNVLVEPLGPHGTPGVMIEQFTETDNGALEDEDLTLTALSGAHGTMLWTHTFDGVYDPSSGDDSDVPAGVFPIRDAAHRAIDFLVPLETTLSGGELQTQGYLVSGVDSTTSPFGLPYSELGSFPTETVVPDINKDGFDDVVVNVPDTYIEALTGGGANAGQMLWMTDAAVDSDAQISAIKDYSHKTVPDIVIQAYVSGKDRDGITVLSGLSGDVLWTRFANDLMLIHKAGPKLTPAVLLASESTGNASNTISATYHYAAISPTNKVIYSKKLTATVHSPGKDELYAYIGTTGDVNGDGSQDVEVNLDTISPYIIVVETAQGSKPKPVVHAKDGIINGRNGDFHSLNFQDYAHGNLHKGAKTDLLGTEAVKGNTRMVGWDGQTRHRYYSRVIPTLGGKTAAVWAWGIRVSGHSCSDIEFDASTKGPPIKILDAPDATTPYRGEEGILTARGARLWTISFPVKDVTGGSLTHYVKPKHYCV